MIHVVNCCLRFGGEGCCSNVPLQVFDESALSNTCKEEMYKCYPDAKRAHLKSGGNFPYLSRSSEVNVMLQVRMQQQQNQQQ